jgi:DNA end-binding protein Ku
MSRPAWSGFLRLSLVSVPVQGYATLNPGDGEIHLNQLHKKCHSRIRYKKVCPIHGEVPNDEIVMGYEFAKDQYVEVEDSERKQARTKSDKAIDIESFVPIEAVNPIYLEGRSYYLLPDGNAGQ